MRSADWVDMPFTRVYLGGMSQLSTKNVLNETFGDGDATSNTLLFNTQIIL